jgi:hypothetical protein
MDEVMRRTVLKAWRSLPSELRSPPASEKELCEFESAFGRIPKEFRWFLSTCGGGPVGSEWVDGVKRLAESHRKFQRESGISGWTMKGVFVIGWDGSGNPFGIELATGRVVVERS